MLLLCFLYCKNDCIDKKMSGFLEVAITYTFHSLLCVRSSGSSAYRRGTCGHLGFIYVQRGRASKFWRNRGGEKKLFSVIFPASSQTVPLPLSWFETHPRWPPVKEYAGLAWNAPGKGISRENNTDTKFLFSEEFMRSEKYVKHHSYLICNEANFLLGEHKIPI